MDVTPDSWIYSEVSQMELSATALLSHRAPHHYTSVRGDWMMTTAMCEQNIDHVLLMVVASGTEISHECLLYNNYYAHPISCGPEGMAFVSYLNECHVWGE